MRRRAVWIILIAALAFQAGNYATRRMGDLDLYHQAAVRVAAGESMYQLSDPHRFLYAPIVAVAFLPLAPLPILPAKLLWHLLNVGLTVVLFRQCAALVFGESRAPPGFYALLLACTFRFVDNNLGHGQVNLVLLWLVLAGYSQHARGRTLLGGFAVGCAILTKPFPAVLLLQMVLRRQWRFAAATVGSVTFLLAIPLVWWGVEYPGMLRDWLGVVAGQVGHYDMGNKANQSISAFVHRWTAEGDDVLSFGWNLSPTARMLWVAGIHGLFLATVVSTSLRIARSGTDRPDGPNGSELALYLLYATVLLPYSWKYYFANLLLPTAVVLGGLYRNRDRGDGAVLGLSFGLNALAGSRVFGKGVGLLFQQLSFHFLAVVALFVACLRHSRKGQNGVRHPGPTDRSEDQRRLENGV